MSRHGWLLSGAIALLALAWLAGPTPSGPPLYDGLGFPDEPYRYVAPPPDAEPTEPPTDAEGVLRLRGGRASLLAAASAEQGPQVQLHLSPVLLDPPPGAATVRVLARPLAPDDQPRTGRIWGNVYRVSVASDTGTVRLRPSQGELASITLRAPSDTPRPVMVYRGRTGGWRQLAASRSGHDTYTATLRGVGDYALVRVPGLPAESTDSRALEIAVFGGTLVPMLGAVLVTRRARNRALETEAAAPIPVDDILEFAERVHRATPSLTMSARDRDLLVGVATDLRIAATGSEPDPERLLDQIDAVLDILRQTPSHPAVNTLITRGGLIRRDLTPGTQR